MASDPELPHSLPASPHPVENDDRERHPLEDTLTFATLTIAVISVGCLFLRAWDVSGWLALAAGLAAACDEFIAKTSRERWLILVSFVLAVVSLAISTAHGAIA